MSSQLAQRLDELSQERARLREAIRRIGQTFASNLDRTALLDLALKTAIDAVRGAGGRISVRPGPEQPPAETIRHGALDEVEAALLESERTVLEAGDVGEADEDGRRRTARCIVDAVMLSAHFWILIAYMIYRLA